MTDTAWVLVVGYGSIGRRHWQNAMSLGCLDVRVARCGPTRTGAFPDPPGAPVYTDLHAALEERPAIVIVANPTSLHASTAIAAMEAGAHVLMEKPLADGREAARTICDAQVRTGRVVSMAYVFRYHPLYRAMKEIVESGKLGRVFHVRSWQASYLPDWHPWEDYRISYAARAELGGGVIRTLDHELDMVHWLCGRPNEVLASVGTLSDLPLNVEDTADMIFSFAGRRQATVHVSFARHAPSRGLSIVGERGTADLDWQNGIVTVARGNELTTEASLDKGFDLNTVYRAMLKEALVAFERDDAAVPLQHGIAALEMAEAALQSSAQRKSCPLADSVLDDCRKQIRL